MMKVVRWMTQIHWLISFWLGYLKNSHLPDELTLLFAIHSVEDYLIGLDLTISRYSMWGKRKKKNRKRIFLPLWQALLENVSLWACKVEQVHIWLQNVNLWKHIYQSRGFNLNDAGNWTIPLNLKPRNSGDKANIYKNTRNVSVSHDTITNRKKV